jgi:hypothetical protein
MGLNSGMRRLLVTSCTTGWRVHDPPLSANPKRRRTVNNKALYLTDPALSNPTTGRSTSMTAPAYRFEARDLALATTLARDRVHRAELRLARVACARIAATVRDILTDDDPRADAPFDAVALLLTTSRDQEFSVDGTYWTADGTERYLPNSSLWTLWTRRSPSSTSSTGRPGCLCASTRGSMTGEPAQHLEIERLRERLRAGGNVSSLPTRRPTSGTIGPCS